MRPARLLLLALLPLLAACDGPNGDDGNLFLFQDQYVVDGEGAGEVVVTIPSHWETNTGTYSIGPSRKFDFEFSGTALEVTPPTDMKLVSTKLDAAQGWLVRLACTAPQKADSKLHVKVKKGSSTEYEDGLSVSPCASRVGLLLGVPRKGRVFEGESGTVSVTWRGKLHTGDGDAFLPGGPADLQLVQPGSAFTLREETPLTPEQPELRPGIDTPRVYRWTSTAAGATTGLRTADARFEVPFTLQTMKASEARVTLSSSVSPGQTSTLVSVYSTFLPPAPADASEQIEIDGRYCSWVITVGDQTKRDQGFCNSSGEFARGGHLKACLTFFGRTECTEDEIP